jgi:predicted  nucleic acid-binding Zn-ribbon protein
MAKSDRTKLDSPRIEELVVKLKQIQSELKQSLLDLNQKLETLDAKSELLGSSLGSFEKDAESRAFSLEVEVKQLREQIMAIKELLGLNKENNLSDSY